MLGLGSHTRLAGGGGGASAFSCAVSYALQLELAQDAVSGLSRDTYCLSYSAVEAGGKDVVLPSNAVALRTAGGVSLSTLAITGNIASVDFSGLAVGYCSFHGCPNITSLDFPALTDGGVQVGVADDSTVPGLETLVCAVVNCTGGIELSGCPNLTSVSLPNLQSCNGFGVQESPNLTTLNIPSIVSTAPGKFALVNTGLTSLSVTTLTTTGQDFHLTHNAALTSASFPAYTTANGDFNLTDNNLLTSANFTALESSDSCFISNNPLLTALNLSALETITGNCGIQDNNALQTLNLNGLVTVTNADEINGVFIRDNPALATLNFGSFVPYEGQQLHFTGNAFSQATVNAILQRLHATNINNCVVDLSGGTSAAPSGAGATAKTALEGKGWTVTTN